MPSPSVTAENLRPLMLSIAYRMVGSFSDAEDLVQEAYVRFHEAGDVDSPKAWLSTVVTRLSIDHLRSARVRREEYPGPWLPERGAVDWPRAWLSPVVTRRSIAPLRSARVRREESPAPWLPEPVAGDPA